MYFLGTTSQTVRYAKLAGLKNGDLLSAAEAAGFDVLVTMDQSIPEQLRDLLPLIPAVLAPSIRFGRAR
jgi:hypothetical protein